MAIFEIAKNGIDFFDFTSFFVCKCNPSPDINYQNFFLIFLGGTSRRGSYYSDDVSKKATVAMVVDSEVEPKSVFEMGKYKFFGGKIQMNFFFQFT